MTRVLHHAAFAVGLAVLVWVGAGYVGHNPLALAVTALVGAFYLMGALELHRFHQATATLATAVTRLSDTPPSLGAWLEPLHPSLRNAVRLRVEGERVALPGPALASYLAGLLVLLGMLGTFVGMVVTLNGTGAALDSATDLQAVRASLSAPVRGLGLAFGTSVAGVAASAMLGLMAALCRRDRLQVAQLLDSRIATTLRVFSRSHQRDASFELLQQQAGAMPLLVDRLQTMMATLAAQHQALHERLLAGQDGFHAKAETVYTTLAASVERSLQHSLTESARIAGATIQPVVEATMASIAHETTALQGRVAQTVQQQLDGLAGRFDGTTTKLAALWQDALAQHQHVSDMASRDTQQALTAATATFEQHAASLLRTLDETQATSLARTAAADQQRLDGWTQTLSTMATSLQQDLQQASERSTAQQQRAAELAAQQQQQAADTAARQQQQLCDTLAQTAETLSTQTQAQARATIHEVARLVQVASEAPRAAAEVIAQLRQQLSDSLVRDNGMLEERARMLQTLATQLDAVNHASTEQRAAIDALVAASADLLQRVGTQFTEQAQVQTEKLVAAAAGIGGSAAEVASLGEAFGFAVQLFSSSNDKLLAQLERIEGALGKTLARSDEQLAYYVAQAREVIDLSIMSQKQIVDDLQQLATRRLAADTAA